MSPGVIILGASARAAAFSAWRAGFAPTAIDLFADRDLAELCPATRIDRYPYGLLSALEKAPDAPWVYTGGLENYPRLVGRMARIRPLWGNRNPGLARVRDPALLAAIVGQAGMDFPPMRTAPPPSEDAAARRWLLKPRRSSGGIAIAWWASVEQEPQRGGYWQQYVPGQSASAVFAAAGGSASLLGCTRQLVGRDIGDFQRPFLYAGSVGPLALPPPQQSRLAYFGDLLARTFGLVGLFGVDLVLRDDRTWVIEVNPRYTASVEVLERASGQSCFALHALACRGENLPAASTLQAQAVCGKRIVYSRRSGRVAAGLDEIAEQWNTPGRPPGLADVPRIGEAIAAGQPVATVFAEAKTAAAVEHELQSKAETIESFVHTGS